MFPDYDMEQFQGNLPGVFSCACVTVCLACAHACVSTSLPIGMKDVVEWVKPPVMSIPKLFYKDLAAMGLKNDSTMTAYNIYATGAWMCCSPSVCHCSCVLAIECVQASAVRARIGRMTVTSGLTFVPTTRMEGGSSLSADWRAVGSLASPSRWCTTLPCCPRLHSGLCPRLIRPPIGPTRQQ